MRSRKVRNISEGKIVNFVLFNDCYQNESSQNFRSAALFRAASGDDPVAVRRLLAVGVDVGVTNPKGMTAKEIAKDRCAPPPLSSQQSLRKLSDRPR